MKSESESPFGTLPYPLKRKIFNLLHREDKKAARRVCPSWRRIIDVRMSFNAVLTNKTRKWLANWSNVPYTLFIRHLTIQNEDFNFRTHKKGLSEAEHFSIGIGVSGDCVLDFFQYFNPKVKSMELWNLSLAKVLPSNIKGIQHTLKWPLLNALVMNAGSDREIKLGSTEEQLRHFRIFLELLHISHFPALNFFKCLLNLENWFYASSNKTRTALIAPLKELLLFIKRHTKTLRSLELTIHSEFQLPFVSGKTISDVFSNLELEEFAGNFDVRNVSLFVHMCSNLRDIKSLQYSEYTARPPKPEEANLVSDVIQTHGTNVTSLTIHKLNRFDCSCLTAFQSLKNLELIILDPTNLIDLPNLVTVSKFSITTFYGHYSSNATCDRVLSLIGNCMPYLREVEIIFHGKGFEFTTDHLDFFIGMKNLLHLTLYEVTPMIKAICEESPGLNCLPLYRPCDFVYFYIFIDRGTYFANLKEANYRRQRILNMYDM